MERYKYFLKTGSGNTEIQLTFNDDETAIFVIKSSWMGSGRHVYRLMGNVRRLSDVYRWIHIEQVEHRVLVGDSEQAEIIDLAILHSRMIYECFRVAESPNVEHPDDLGAVQAVFNSANWNETFDLLVLLHPSAQGYLLAVSDGSLDLEDAPLTDAQLKWLVRSLFSPDKTKYALENVG